MVYTNGRHPRTGCARLIWGPAWVGGCWMGYRMGQPLPRCPGRLVSRIARPGPGGRFLLEGQIIITQRFMEDHPELTPSRKAVTIGP